MTLGTRAGTRERGARSGFTLIELLVALIIIAALGTIIYRFMQRGDAAKTREVASRFLGAFQAAQSEATATGKFAVLYVDTIPTVTAPTMASGVVADTDTLPANYRPILAPAAYIFDDGVNFSPGSASVGPAGTAVTTRGVNPLICSDRCNSITTPSGSSTYYFSAANDSSIVYAVVIYAPGQSRLFRYKGGGVWE